MVVALGTIASSPRFSSFVVKAGAGSGIEGIASSAGVANVVDVNVNVGVGAGAGTGAGGDAERDLAAVDIARGVANVGVDVGSQQSISAAQTHQGRRSHRYRRRCRSCSSLRT